MLIILDNSGSVREVFEEEKFIALRVAKLLNAEDTQVGIVSFSNHARFASQLKNPIGYTHVLENLENLTGEGEATNTAESLKLAKDELRNVRPNAWKAIILVTDGFSVNSIEELESIMTELSISGVEMFVATASDNYDMRELSIYAGGRPDRVFVRQNLTEIPDAVAQARCRATSKFQSSMGSGEPWDTSTLSSVSNTAPSEFYGGAVAQEWINMMSTTISSMTFPADRTNNGTQLMITDSVGIKEADELTKLQTSTSISNSEITETVSTRHNEITAIPFIPKENSDNGAITIATPKLQDGQKPTGDSIIIVMENSSISTGNFLAESTSTDVAEQSNSTLWLTPFSSATEDISTTNIHLITSSSTISEFGISETPLSNIQNYTDAVGLPESGNSDDATRMKINIEPTMTIIPSPQVGTWIRGVDKVPTLSTSEMNSIGSNSSNSLNSTQLSLVILPTTKQVQYAGDSDSPPISSVSPNPAFPTTSTYTLTSFLIGVYH